VVAIALLLVAAVVSQAQVTFTEYPVPTAGGYPYGITAGPDGNLWFTEREGNKIATMTTSGTITEFPMPTGGTGHSGNGPSEITVGPDGNLWFTEGYGNKIGRITTHGVITEFPTPTGNSAPYGITVGPDGNLWFTETSGNNIGRITTSGVITEFPVPTGNSHPRGITVGPDGNLWFTEAESGNKIGRITTSGVITEFPASGEPTPITVGPDGNLWFGEYTGNKIGKITTNGVITEFPTPTQTSPNGINGITVGPDGNLWFTEYAGHQIGRITTNGVITEFPVLSGNLPVEITVGPDGNLWFTEEFDKLSKITLPSAGTLSTDHGGNTGTVTLSIFENGIPAGSTAKLVCSGQPDIVGTNDSVSADGKTLTATFDLTGATPGLCSVVIIEPNGSTLTIPQPFTIEQGGAPQIWVDIMGLDKIRIGREQTYYIVYGNSRNVDGNHIGASIAVQKPLTAVDSGILFVVDRYTSATDGDVISFIIPTIPPGSASAVPYTVTVPNDPALVQHPFTIRAEQQAILSTSSTATVATASTSSPSAGGLRGLLYGPLLYDGCGKPLHVQCSTCEPQWNSIQVAETITENESLLSQQATLNFLAKATEVADDIVNTTVFVTVVLPELSAFIAEALAEGVTTQAEWNVVIQALGQTYFNYSKHPDFTDPTTGYDAAVRWARDYSQAVTVYKAKVVNILGIVKSQKLQDLADKGLAATAAAQNAIDTLRDAWPTLQTLWNELTNARQKYTYDNNVYLCGEVNTYLSCVNAQCGGGSTISPSRSGPGVTRNGQIVASLDPNDKIGSQGDGTQQYISGTTPLRYVVYFGNQDNATAPAQQVVITDQLDLTHDDLITFGFGPIAFGSQLLSPPPLQSHFSTTVDLRPSNNLLVAVTANLNSGTGLITWKFTSLDPTTNQPPTDPTAGFLPPGGTGSVVFTVVSKQGLPTNTQIQNQATIVFDVNAPINTPLWVNTLDNDPPTSHVLPLPAVENSASFTIQLAGTDVGSGVSDFTIFVSDNGNPFTAWQTTTATSAVYPGVAGHTYGFFSQARDLAGNVEVLKTQAEATTQVVADTTPPVITISANPKTLWPPNGKLVPVTISGTITDNELGGTGVNASTAAYAVTDKYGLIQPSGPITLGANGSYSFTIQLEASRKGDDKDGRQYIITVSAQDNAGNKGSAATGVLVPHDQGQ
jgi:streptogramin lyase